jgi:hypothetical protein
MNKPTKNRFKKGDRVVVTGPVATGEKARVVSIGATKHYGPDRNVRLRFDDGNLEYFLPDDLQHE